MLSFKKTKEILSSFIFCATNNDKQAVYLIYKGTDNVAFNTKQIKHLS